MNYRLLLLLFSISFIATAQLVRQPLEPAISTNGVANLTAGNTSKSFQFSDSLSADKVTAVVWSGKFPQFGFHFNRNISGVSTSGNVNINIGSGQEAINPDIVIGNSGNTILVIYQIFDRIETRIFDWGTTSYTEVSHDTLSTPVTGYVYGNPRVDFHEATGQVVATYFSYDVSPTFEGFALLGDIHGNWITPTGSAPFNAYRVSNSCAFLPASAGNLKGPVSVSIFHSKGFGTQVHFALNYIKNTGDTELWHLSMPVTNLLNSNSTTFIDEDKLYTASNSSYNVRWCSIDTWPITDTSISKYNYRDWWIVAVPIANRAAGKADILTYRGIDSGSVQGPLNHTKNQLGLCENNLVDVAFGPAFATIIWRHTYCNNDTLLDGDDIIESNIPLIAQFPWFHFRVNNHFLGDQSSPSLAGSDDLEILASWREESNGDIFYKNLINIVVRIGIWESGILKSEQLSLFPNPSQGKVLIDGLAPEPHTYKLINSMGVIVDSGELIYEGRFNLDFSDLPKGTYLLTIDDSTTKTLIID